jgi:asparagine synthase (glutamine-hydrolysing)
MCGIAGFIGPWSAALLDAMVDALRHRGPDGEGRHIDAPAGLGLGHARLSIIDLSDAAAQPMASACGRYVIAFNGEIYNYRTLRAGLEAAGHRFRTQSDTEVLVELFARDGAGCLKALHGIFAFAIWDAEARRLFVARDQMGVKPLYYAALPDGFLFASELKSLVRCPDLPREIDPVAVADHLGFLWTAGEATMLRAVRKLRPGCALWLDDGGVRVERWYRTPRPGHDAPRSNAAPGDLRRLIDNIVAEQMVADVPVGALLSGGVDSSAIVAAMCRAAEPARITTFCASVGGGGAADNFGDDAPHARMVAQALGVKLIEVPCEADLIEALPNMIWALDEPTADFAALQTLLLARAARDAGIKVLLSGVGGDDLFTGYARHTAALIRRRLDGVPGLRRIAAAIMSLASPGTLRGRRMQRMGQLLALDEDAMLAEAMSFSGVDGAMRRALMAPALRDAAPAGGMPAPFAASLAATRGMHPVERLLNLEQNGFLPDHNLNYTDKMAMQAGVEVRVPLCAPELVSFAAALPLASKIDRNRTKVILRDSQIGRVPDAVLTRPKQGFGVPMRGWLQGPARPAMEALTASNVVAARGLFDADAVAALRAGFLAGRVDAAMTLFAMMAIELWCRALGDARPLSELEARAAGAPGRAAATH